MSRAFPAIALVAVSLFPIFACRVEVEPLPDDPPSNPAPAPTASGSSTSTPTEDSGPPPDTNTPTELFYAACLTQLAFGDTSKVLSFYSEVKASASASTLNVAIQPLALAGGKPPTTFSASGRVGARIDASSVTGSAGAFALSLGTMDVPGSANPISGSDITVETAKLEGTYAKDRFCARLGGKLTKPIAADLEPANNICIFVKVADGGATPALAQGDFVCAK